MSMFRHFSRMVRPAAMALLVAACERDPLSGPARIIGDVLLDITITPAATAVVPGGTVAISGGNRDTLTVTLQNLPPLPAGTVYQVLLAADSASRAGADAAVSNLRPVSGRIIRTTRSRRPVNRDSLFFSQTVDTTAFAPLVISAADTNQTFVLRVVGVPQGDSVKKFTHVVVTATTNPLTAGQTVAPSDRNGFLFAVFRNTKNTVLASDDIFADAAFTAGSFAVNPSRLFRFGAAGAVNGAIRGREIRINFRGLVRPPQGFRYASWLIDARTGRNVRLGELRTPEPGSISLNDADIATGSFVTRDGILAAEVRANADSLNIEFDDFTRYALVLEVKGAVPARAPGWEVLVGPIPESVSSRHPSSGSLSGTVTSQSGAPVAGTTLYLTGVDLSFPLLVTAADATGAFRFRSVNVGSYTLNAIPRGDTQVRASVPVTIGSAPDSTGAVRGNAVVVQVTIP